MNIVECFRNWILESNDEIVENKPAGVSELGILGQIGISQPDKMGEKINGILGPEIMATRGSEKDFFSADFQTNITNGNAIGKAYPHIYERLQGLDLLSHKFIYLMWKKSSDLNISDILKFFNVKCSSVLPQKYSEKDVLDMGIVDRLGVDGNPKMKDDSDEKTTTTDDKKYHLYLIEIPNTEEEQQKDVKMVNQIKKNFVEKGIKDQYKNKGLTFRFGMKEHLEKYFGSEEDIMDSLEDGILYMAMICVKNSLNQQKLFNIFEVISQGAVSEDKEYSKSDIIKVGGMSVKHKASGQYIDMDVYIIEL